MQSSTTSSVTRLSYLPGLDGLRALAVLAVFFYHARLPWAVGGYLGVESFFVISGYLITTLLLREQAATGQIALGDFWLRRVRRLLPALWLVLAATVLLAGWWAPEALTRLREDILAALLYVTNWVFILRQVPYFEQFGQPPMLQHLWSLAVEEQFYLIWPVALSLLLRAFRVREAAQARRLTVPLALAAGLAGWWMATVYDPLGDPARVYYGTDTRAAGFLLGAALATIVAPGHHSRSHWAFDVAGLVGLLGLAVAFTRLDENRSFLYRGGFLLVDGLTALVIVAASRPSTHTAQWLGSAVWRWLGARSYGIYLWHWPLMVISGWGAASDGSVGVITALQLIATLCLADFSYRWIEQPIRQAGFRAWGRAVQNRWGEVRGRVGVIGSMAVLMGGLLLQPVFKVAATAVASLTPTMTATAQLESHPPLPASTLTPEAATLAPTRTRTPAPQRTHLPTASSTHTAAPAISTTPTPSSSPMPPSTSTQAAAGPTSNPATPPPVQPPATTTQLRVTLIGDSVMESVAPRLEQRLERGTYYLTARRSRRMGDVFALIPELAAQGRLASTVVIHLGTNQAFDDSVFDDVMRQLVERGVTRVIFLNVKRPVVWEASLNQRLAEGVSRWPQAQLVDWNGPAQSQPGWFGADQVHPTSAGAEAYVNLLLSALGMP